VRWAANARYHEIPFLRSPDRCFNHSYSFQTNNLVEWVGAGTPVGEEDGETDGLHDAGDNTDGDGVEWALLGDNLGDDLKGSLVPKCVRACLV